MSTNKEQDVPGPEPETGHVVAVDFCARDLDKAIDALAGMRERGEMTGFIFAVRIKEREKPVFGAAGCFSKPSLATVGAAKLLLNAVVNKMNDV